MDPYRRCDLGCDWGWLTYSDDPEGRPTPCPNCKPHLAHCRECGAAVIVGRAHSCPKAHAGHGVPMPPGLRQTVGMAHPGRDDGRPAP